MGFRRALSRATIFREMGITDVAVLHHTCRAIAATPTTMRALRSAALQQLRYDTVGSGVGFLA
jgi:hypothetical protein